MIDIKSIKWVKEISDYSGTISYEAYVRDYRFLSIINYDKDDYRIFLTFPTFKFYGNSAYNEYGSFSSLDECKSKCEELIKEEILSFIDIRDLKINKIINDNDKK